MKRILATLAAAIIAGATLNAHAETDTAAYFITETEGDYDDALAILGDTVVNRGLVIDYTGHPGDMLTRTGADVGMESPYLNANYMQFCSAKFTHAAVAASPENLAICPFVVFAYELKSEPGKVYLGYRKPAGAAGTEANLAEIDKLLRGIVTEAAE